MNKYQITSILFLLCALFISLVLGQTMFIKNPVEGFETLTPSEIQSSIQEIIDNPNNLSNVNAADILVNNPSIMDDPTVASLIVKNTDLMQNSKISNYPSILTITNKSIFDSSTSTPTTTSTTTPTSIPTTTSTTTPTPVPSNYNISSECYTNIKQLQNPYILASDLPTILSNIQLTCSSISN